MSRYQSVELTRVESARINDRVENQRTIVGIDIAKTVQYATVMVPDNDVVVTVRWRHPAQTPLFVAFLEELPASSVEVVLEPTGTYGDALRHQLSAGGFDVYRINPKRVHDAAEVFDGVPSSHDAKAANLLCVLRQMGVGELWPLGDEQRRTLTAAISVMELYDEQYRRNVNRLEALLARHWPELSSLLELTSLTLPALLAQFGFSDGVNAALEEVAALMATVSKGNMRQPKITAIIASAETTVGQPAVAGERESIMAIASDTLRARKSLRQARTAVEQLSEQVPAAAAMGRVVGKSSGAVLVSKLGDPKDFPSARSYEKTAGANLKERSSGQHQGRLSLTKRGSPVVRKYLYLAVLRLIQHDPVIRAWYLKKVERDGGVKMKALVAVMRKLVRALWHVGRGAPFDSTKLYETKRLGLPAVSKT